jgi:hypothetical protein
VLNIAQPASTYPYALQEVCVEYNREGLRTNLHYQNIGRKQLIGQITPNIQRLYAAMQEVQTALAPNLETKPPKAAQQQQQQPKQQPKQQQKRRVKPGQLVLNSNDELAVTASKIKRSNAYARPQSPHQQQQIKPQSTESQQRKSQTAQQQQQQQQQQQLLLSEWLARGLVNLSLQVSQLQELLPPAADDSDALPAGICGGGSNAAGSSISAAAGQAEETAAASSFDASDAAESARSHLVLQLLESTSPAVQLQAAAALEKLCADADNAHCLATLGAAPRLVALLSSSIPALQTVAANVLKQLAGTSPILKEAVVAAGAVRALAHLLCAGADAETGTAAAAALGCIAAGSAVHKKTIAAMPSAISGLVALLHSGETAAVEAAAATLRSLTSADAGTCVRSVLSMALQSCFSNFDSALVDPNQKQLHCLRCSIAL